MFTHVFVQCVLGLVYGKTQCHTPACLYRGSLVPRLLSASWGQYSSLSREGGGGGGNTGLGPGVQRGLKDSEVNTVSYGPFRIVWLRPPPMQDIGKIK